MNHQRKLTSRQSTDQQQTQALGPQEFATPEAMLRHDALLTPVPPTVAMRLQDSIGRSAAARVPWWRRLFRKL